MMNELFKKIIVQLIFLFSVCLFFILQFYEIIAERWNQIYAFAYYFSIYVLLVQYNHAPLLHWIKAYTLILMDRC